MSGRTNTAILADLREWADIQDDDDETYGEPVHAEAADLIEQLLDLASDFVDAEDCHFDHHGYCQAHTWFETEPACPHARAKALLENA